MGQLGKLSPEAGIAVGQSLHSPLVVLLMFPGWDNCRPTLYLDPKPWIDPSTEVPSHRGCQRGR